MLRYIRRYAYFLLPFICHLFAKLLPFICQMPIIKTCLSLFFSLRPSFGQLWCSVTTKCQHVKLPLATFSLNSCIIQQKLCILAFVLLSTRHFDCSFLLRITTSKRKQSKLTHVEATHWRRLLHSALGFVVNLQEIWQ